MRAWMPGWLAGSALESSIASSSRRPAADSSWFESSERCRRNALIPALDVGAVSCVPVTGAAVGVGADGAGVGD